MDKLQPLVTHKFWIAFGLALIMALVGWWLETNSIAKEIDTRKTAIEGARKASSVGGGVPNKRWTDGLKVVNEKEDEAAKRAAELLYEEQRKSMVWPPAISSSMREVPYRGRAKDSNPLNIYRRRYRMELERIMKIVDPFDPLTDKGKVAFKAGVDTIPSVPRDAWLTHPPTWKEMWDAQEDVWLTEDLLRSIAELNRDTDGDIRASNIVMIEQLSLHGGSRTDGGSGGLGGGMGEGIDDMGGDFGGYGNEPEAEEGGGGGGIFGGGVGGATTGNDTKSADVKFSPKEEFGNDSGASSGGDSEDSESVSMAGGDPTSMTMTGGGAGSSSEGKSTRRYVDDDESMPYRTRGFYLVVTMRDDMLPDLLASLTDSKWPVEILRVHREDRNRQSPGASPGTGMNSFAGIGADSQTSGTGFGGQPATSGFGPQGGLGAGFGAPQTFGGGLGTNAGGFGQGQVGTSAGGEGTGRGMPGAESLTAALQSSTMSTVVIAGLMTLYDAPATDPNDTDPNDTDPNDTDPNNTDPNNTDPNNTDPNNTDPNNADPNNADPNNTDPNNTDPNNTDPNNTDPNNADPNNTDPNNTDPNNTTNN